MACRTPNKIPKCFSLKVVFRKLMYSSIKHFLIKLQSTSYFLNLNIQTLVIIYQSFEVYKQAYCHPALVFGMKLLRYFRVLRLNKKKHIIQHFFILNRPLNEKSRFSILLFLIVFVYFPKIFPSNFP